MARFGHRQWVVAAVLAAIAMASARLGLAEEGEDIDAPSVAAIHLAGSVTAEGVCELRCEVTRGPEGAPPVDDLGFHLNRTSDTGADNAYPDVELADLAGDLRRCTFTYVDRTVKRGHTYRYHVTYCSDVYLASDIVVLTVPSRRHSPPEPQPRAPEEDALRVEIIGKKIWGVNYTNLVRARANKPGATFTWRAVDPRVCTVLASHGDKALLRGEDVPGYQSSAFHVECRAGEERASAFFWPGVLKMIIVTPLSAGESDIARARADAAEVRPLLQEVYRPGYEDTVRLHQVEELISHVGAPALPEIRRRYDECDDPGARYRLVGLMGRIDKRYVVESFYEEALSGQDMALLWSVLSKAAYMEKGRTKEKTRLLVRALSHESAYVRHTAAEHLGRCGTEAALAELERLRDSDPDPGIRFTAALAIQGIRTGAFPRTKELPNWGQEEMKREDVELARMLYPEVLKELENPPEGAKSVTLAVMGSGRMVGTKLTQKPRKAEDFNWCVRAGSAIARFACLGQATLPVISERLIHEKPSGLEMAMMCWGLSNAKVGLPKRVEEAYVERFLAAKGAERTAVFERYIAIQDAWIDSLSMDKKAHGRLLKDIKEGGTAGRLRAIAWMMFWMKSKNWAGTLRKVKSKGRDWFRVSEVELSPDGQFIAVVWTDGVVRLMRTKTLETIWSREAEVTESCLRFLVAPRLLVAGKYPGWPARNAWSLALGTLAKVPKGRFSPDGAVCAVPEKHLVKLVRTRTGEALSTLKGHESPVDMIVFSPDGKRVATQDRDGRLILWDAAEGERIAALQGDVDPFDAFSLDGSTLLVEQQERELVVLDAAIGKERTRIKALLPGSRYAVSPDGKHVATSSGPEILVWDGATGKRLLRIRHGAPFCGYLRFFPDGRKLVAQMMMFLCIYDASGGKELLRAKEAEIKFIDDGKLAVIYAYEGIKVLDARTLSEVARVPPIKGRGASAFCEHTDLIAQAGGTKLVVRRARTGEKLAERDTAPLHPRPASTLTFDDNAVDVILRLRSGNDPVAEIAREMWPLPADLRKAIENNAPD